MTKLNPPPSTTAPDHLSPSTRAWWMQTVRDFELTASELHLLTLAGEALDRGRQASEVIAAEGITVRAADGAVKTHPAVAIERDSRIAFARMLRQLDLRGGAPVPPPVGE